MCTVSLNGTPLSPVNISSRSKSKIRQDDLERQAVRDMRRDGERERGIAGKKFNHTAQPLIEIIAD